MNKFSKGARVVYNDDPGYTPMPFLDGLIGEVLATDPLHPDSQCWVFFPQVNPDHGNGWSWARQMSRGDEVLRQNHDPRKVFRMAYDELRPYHLTAELLYQ